jgi:hypothetical protein
MKREATFLLKKATDSLILAIDHFNRPIDRGRVSAVLILLDHSFEMLLEAAILHRGGRIRKARKRETIGFDSYVSKGVSDASIRYLTEEQAITLQTINGLRDAARHLLSISLKSNCTFTPKAASRCLEIYCSRYSSRVSSVYSRRVFCLYRRLLQQKLICFLNQRLRRRQNC